MISYQERIFNSDVYFKYGGICRIRGQVGKATKCACQYPIKATPQETKNFKKRIAPYQYPRIVAFVEKLPKTICGKRSARAIKAEKNKRNAKAYKIKGGG